MDSLLLARWIRRWGFPAGLVTLILICGLTTAMLSRYAELNGWTAHTHEVIGTITEVEVSLERSETSVRGFLLYHSEEFLRTFAGASAALLPSVERLATLVADNPAQRARVAELGASVDEHLRRLKALIGRGGTGARRSDDARVALARLTATRALLKVMHADERALLVERRNAAEDFARLASLLMVIGALTAIGLVTLSFVSMRRALRANVAQAGLLRLIFDSIGDGLIVTGVDGVFTHYNRNAGKVLNVSLERVRTIDELGLLHGVSSDVSPTKRALRGEVVTDREFSITRDGVMHWISIDSRPVVAEDGARLGALAVIRDVTERRNLETEWRLARESAIEASRLKSDFLATMSHEIRTPMNGVIGMSTLLLATPLTADQASFVRTIKNSADSLLALINQVLDHARIESGRLELVPVDFNLHDLLDGVVDLFRYMARSKNLELRLEIDPETPEMLNGDVDRLRQVIVNLVGNALKFTEHGYVEVSVRGREPDLEFAVRDTGRGISPGAQARLFQKFSQVHEAQVGGSGLGLMISRELVTAMGGAITVDSAEGFGSRFAFTVKMDRALTCPMRPVASGAAQPRLSGRVLVAEDQPVNQLVIRKFLEQFGVACEVVVDGGAAVRAVSERAFDLVLMDCQMRPVDGYEATLQIRAAEHVAGRAPLPIVALTAEGMSGDRRRCFDVGMDDFLAKPIAIDQLHALLVKYLPTADDAAAPDVAAPDPATVVSTDADASSGKLVHDAEALARLEGFESEGRPLAAVLYDEFRTNGRADLEKLVRAGREAADWTEVRYVAHSLKSSGRTLGLVKYGEVCETLEKTADDATEVGALIAELERLHDAGCQWLSDILDIRQVPGT